MSIIKGLKTQAVSTAASYGIRKVSGILRKQLGLQDVNRQGGPVSKSSAEFNKPTNIFSFPLDVTGGPGIGNQGHYVMFYINEQQDAELRFGERKDGETSVIENASQANVPQYITRMVGDTAVREENTNGYENQQHLDMVDPGFKKALSKRKTKPKPYKAGGSTAYLKRAPTVRLDTAIALYMPPQATYINQFNYTDTEIGSGARAATDAYGQIMSGAGTAEVIGSTMKNLGTGLSEGLMKTATAAVGAIPGLQGTREAYEAAQGAIVADRMELAFKGLNKRKFQFQFKFLPKNKRESDEVRNIIFAFRANAAPEFVGGDRAGRKMRVPNTFDIQYMYDGNENQYLQKISTCVLENITVTYGGDRFRTFTPNEEGAPPVETQCTLEFSEMELITKERIYEGY
tara:strand:+ start:4500 stop:5705 length:1206 start_codon:yes stop_codon:yes gene_type:complete